MNAIDSSCEVSTGMENRLIFWLSMDAWGLDEATQIFAGIDPDKTIKPRAGSHSGASNILGSITLFNGRRIPEPPPERIKKIVAGEFCDRFEFVEDYDLDTYPDDCEEEMRKYESNELNAYFQYCEKNSRLFNNPTSTLITPTEWIERATTKRISIPWLKWAIAHDVLPGVLKGKVITVDKSGLVNLVDRPLDDVLSESPEARRERIRKRVDAEKAKRTKAFIRVVAEEEGISSTRIKQLLKDDAAINKDAQINSQWAGLVTKTKQASSKKISTKY